MHGTGPLKCQVDCAMYLYACANEAIVESHLCGEGAGTGTGADIV